MVILIYKIKIGVGKMFLKFIRRIKQFVHIEHRNLKFGFNIYYNNGRIFIPFSIWLNGNEYKPDRPICIEVKDREDAEAIIRMVLKGAGKKLFQIRTAFDED